MSHRACPPGVIQLGVTIPSLCHRHNVDGCTPRSRAAWLVVSSLRPPSSSTSGLWLRSRPTARLNGYPTPLITRKDQRQRLIQILIVSPRFGALLRESELDRIPTAYMNGVASDWRMIPTTMHDQPTTCSRRPPIAI